MRSAGHLRAWSEAPSAIQPYWQVARRSCRRASTYRGATFAGVFTNTVFGFLMAYVLVAVYRHRATVGSFDAVDVLTFTFVSQGLLATVGAFGGLELAQRISSGDVVTDLYRPLHFQAYWLSQDMGRAGFQMIFRGVPPFLVGALIFRLRLPADPTVWVAFAVSVALAVVVSFAIRFLIALCGFWLLDSRGAAQVALIIGQFLSGAVIPLTFLSPAQYVVLRALPFAALGQLPIEVFLGKHRALTATAGVLGLQVAWAVVLIGAGEVVVARALRKLVVQGG